MQRFRTLLLVLAAQALLLGACDEPDVTAQDNRDPMSLVSEPDAGPAYQGPAPVYSKVNVFSKDVIYPGYLHFRIPALAVTPKGTLLAFTEMRTGGDFDPKTLAYRRSTDNGETWGPVTLLEEHTVVNVFGNETVVVDNETGYIHLFYNQVFNTPSGTTGTMYYKVSTDDGVTWSARKAVPNVVNAAWRPAGPGIGIQLERGNHAGRLIIPGRYTDGGRSGNYLMYSDDGGETWHAGFQSTSTSGSGILENETACVELAGAPGGESIVYINARNQASPTEDVYRRLDAYAGNSGESIASSFQRNNYIKTERVQGALLRWSATDQGDARNRILFSCVSWAPAFGGGGAQARRRHVGIWSSFDESDTWNPVAKRIQDVKGGYSSMGRTSDGLIAILFEEGPDSYFSETSLVKINEAFLDVPLTGAKWDFEELKEGDVVEEGGSLEETYRNGNRRKMSATGNLRAVAGAEVFHQQTALSFDGKTQLKLNDIDTWTQFDFHENASFTVEIILKAKGNSGTRFLVGRPHKSLWPQWYLQLDAEGHPEFRLDDDEKSMSLKSSVQVTDGLWHHIAAVRDREAQKLYIYVDGELSGEIKDELTGSVANRRDLLIGGSNAGDGFVGEIDFVRISPAAISNFIE